MKSIKFNEIIECSSQQSILSGQAGFGIRTITEGFNPELARKSVMKSVVHTRLTSPSK